MATRIPSRPVTAVVLFVKSGLRRPVRTFGLLQKSHYNARRPAMPPDSRQVDMQQERGERNCPWSRTQELATAFSADDGQLTELKLLPDERCTTYGQSFGFSTRSGGRRKPYAPTADACFQRQRTDAVTLITTRTSARTGSPGNHLRFGQSHQHRSAAYQSRRIKHCYSAGSGN